MLLFLFVACLPLSLSFGQSPIATNVSAAAPLIGGFLVKKGPSKGQITQSRSLMDMLNPFSKLKQFNNGEMTEEDIDLLKERCSQIEGAGFVNNECYAYFEGPLNFYDAQAACINNRGKLWTPDLTDAFLFEKMMAALPQITKGPREATWLNAVYDRSTGSYTDGDHRDVTNDYLILVNENDYVDTIYTGDTGCMLLDSSYGSFFTYPFDCVENEKSFVCELFLGRLSGNGDSDNPLLKMFGLTLNKGK